MLTPREVDVVRSKLGNLRSSRGVSISVALRLRADAMVHRGDWAEVLVPGRPSVIGRLCCCVNYSSRQRAAGDGAVCVMMELAKAVPEADLPDQCLWLPAPRVRLCQEYFFVAMSAVVRRAPYAHDCRHDAACDLQDEHVVHRGDVYFESPVAFSVNTD